MIEMIQTAVPWLTTEQMVEVDRAMMEDYGIALIQMMENAGRNLAHLARTRFLGGDACGADVVVLAGPGGNGGGALVCARRLAAWGTRVSVIAARADTAFTPIPAHQLDVIRRMGVVVRRAADLPDVSASALIIDGLIGYSLSGDPRGDAADLIRWANSADASVLSLDVPSGIDTTTGTIHTPAVVATATMTLALPKQGLRARGVPAHVGELYLADISVPPELYASPALGLEVGAIFAKRDIVRLN
ncbi:MAG: NAD(P)H-hydrate epimerase [Myxococcota bacterium]|jgi:NAD(P)H-hydrate epimerase